MKPNNNPKNRKGLLDYQKRQLELSKITEDDARKRRIQSNLDKWENSLPKVLQLATPKNLHQSTIEKIKRVPLKPPYEKQMIISAENITSATFVAYATLYALIQGGYVTPSEIKVTSILDGYNNINGMFTARKWKDNFFDSNAKVLLIEGCSKSLTLLGSKGEDQFWRELIELTRNNDKLVIITYSTDELEQTKGIFIPELTSEKTLNSKLIRKSVFVPLNMIEEEEIKNEQIRTYKSL